MFPVGQQHIIDPRVDGGDLGAEVTPAAFNLGMHDPPHPEEHADPGSARLRFYGRPVLVTTISVSLLLTTVRHEGAEGRPRWPPSCSHAARGMRVGPSEPPGRGRLQTAVRCFGQEPGW